MPRKHYDKILLYLYENGHDSNMSVKSELGISDDSYESNKTKLLDEGIIEKYKCYGGGIKLTKKGEKKAQKVWEKYKGPDVESEVRRELELYKPFRNTLREEASENEENAIICKTSELKIPGKWSNPDLTKISIRHYKYLQKRSVFITTYEVKRWDREGWNVKSALETAGQNRFAHESYLVFEWPSNYVDFEQHVGDRIVSACERFGIGLIKFYPYYSKWRFSIEREPQIEIPPEENMEEYLDYVFSKNPKLEDRYFEHLENNK